MAMRAVVSELDRDIARFAAATVAHDARAAMTKA